MSIAQAHVCDAVVIRWFIWLLVEALVSVLITQPSKLTLNPVQIGQQPLKEHRGLMRFEVVGNDSTARQDVEDVPAMATYHCHISSAMSAQKTRASLEDVV